MIKSWQIYVGSLLLAFILGGVAARAVIGKPKTITNIDTLDIYETYHDTTVVTDTIIVSVTDTFMLSAETPFGEIPTRWHTLKHDIPDGFVTVASQYRGMIYNQHVTVRPYPRLQPVAREPFLKYFASLGLFVDIDKQLSGEVATGLRFADRVSLVGKVDIETPENSVEWKPKVGVRFGL